MTREELTPLTDTAVHALSVTYRLKSDVWVFGSFEIASVEDLIAYETVTGDELISTTSAEPMND